jgi:hypothetical protein
LSDSSLRIRRWPPPAARHARFPSPPTAIAPETKRARDSDRYLCHCICNSIGGMSNGALTSFRSYCFAYILDTLEAQLGFSLFDRGTTRKPKLTPQGEAVVSEARAVAHIVEALRARVRGFLDATSAWAKAPRGSDRFCADVRGLGPKVCRGPPPQSARASSLRCGRSRSGHPASLAGYLGGQVINSGEEQFENRRGVCLIVT